MTYLKINDTLYPASFRQRVQDTDWLGRGSMAITVSMSHEQAAQTFVNGLRWEHVQQGTPYADKDGNPVMPEPVITDYSEYEIAGPITDNRDGTITAKMGKALSGECNAALTGEAKTMTVREATELRQQMETVFEKAAPSMTADEVIQTGSCVSRGPLVSILLVKSIPLAIKSGSVFRITTMLYILTLSPVAAHGVRSTSPIMV